MDTRRKEKNREAAQRSYWRRKRERKDLEKKCARGEQTQLQLHRQVRRLRQQISRYESVLAGTLCKGHNKPQSFAGSVGPSSVRGSVNGISTPGVTPTATPAVTPVVTPAAIPATFATSNTTQYRTRGEKLKPCQQTKTVCTNNNGLGLTSLQCSDHRCGDQGGDSHHPVPAAFPHHDRPLQVSTSGHQPGLGTGKLHSEISFSQSSTDWKYSRQLSFLELDDQDLPFRNSRAVPSMLPCENQPDEFLKASVEPSNVPVTATEAEAACPKLADSQPIPEASYPTTATSQSTQDASYLTTTTWEQVPALYPTMTTSQPIPDTYYPTAVTSQPVPEASYPTMAIEKPISEYSFPAVEVSHPQPAREATFTPTAVPQPIPEAPSLVSKDACLSGFHSGLPSSSPLQGPPKIPTPCSDPVPGRWHMEMGEDDPMTTSAIAVTGQERPLSASFTETAMFEGAAAVRSSWVVPAESSSVAPVLSDLSVSGESVSLLSDNTLDLMQFMEKFCDGKGEESHRQTSTEPPARKMVRHYVYVGTQRRQGIEALSLKAAKSSKEDTEETEVLNTPELDEFFVINPSSQGGGHDGGDTKQSEFPGKMEGVANDDGLSQTAVSMTSLTFDDVNVKLKKKYQ